MAQQPVSIAATHTAAEMAPGTAEQTISADQRGSVIVGRRAVVLRRETMTTAIEDLPGVVLLVVVVVVVAAAADREEQM